MRELRRRLGIGVPVLGPDAWADGPSVFELLGRHARNIHLTYQGVPLERLGTERRRFSAEFGSTQPGGYVTSDAVYAAAATEILLDAIARSDGSRASVTRALLATDVDDGPIGAVRFDAKRRRAAARPLGRPRHAANRHGPGRRLRRGPRGDHLATVNAPGA